MTQQRTHKRRRLVVVAATIVTAAVMVAVALTYAGFGCWHAPPPPQAATLPTGPDADLLAGQWEGTWSSTARDDGGKLTCEVRRLDDGNYNADFHAKFAKVLSHNSSVTLQVSKNGPKWQFAGQKDLGILSGGVYTYKGYATADEFYSTYNSKFDRGIFRMKRPGAATQPGTTATKATTR